jgi:hypothetical protein
MSVCETNYFGWPGMHCAEPYGHCPPGCGLEIYMWPSFPHPRPGWQLPRCEKPSLEGAVSLYHDSDVDGALSIYPPSSFFHKCDNCGFSDFYLKKYPHHEYERVNA